MTIRKGFTLIELMIVIAIIAIIAAIAIPGLLRARIAANERNAATSMKAVVTAEENLKGNDVDRNGIGDYWTADLAGLYCIVMAATSKPTACMSDLGMVYADNFRFGIDQGAVWAGIDMDGDGVPDTNYDDSIITTRSPKAGYWFQAMINNDSPTPVAYMQNTDTTVPAHNVGEYAFCAMPAAWDSVGNFCFIVSNIGSVLRRDFGSNTVQIVVPGTQQATFDGTVATDWPPSAVLSTWGKVE